MMMMTMMMNMMTMTMIMMMTMKMIMTLTMMTMTMTMMTMTMMMNMMTITMMMTLMMMTTMMMLMLIGQWISIKISVNTPMFSPKNCMLPRVIPGLFCNRRSVLRKTTTLTALIKQNVAIRLQDQNKRLPESEELKGKRKREKEKLNYIAAVAAGLIYKRA